MLVLHYQEKMQMNTQRQRTSWETGMDPTGRNTHMFEEDWCNKKRPNMKYPGNLKTGNVETKLSNFFLFSNLNWYLSKYTVLHLFQKFFKRKFKFVSFSSGMSFH